MRSKDSRSFLTPSGRSAKTFNADLAIEGVLLTMLWTPPESFRARLRSRHRRLGQKCFAASSQERALAEAPSFGQPILLYGCSVSRRQELPVPSPGIHRRASAARAGHRPSESGDW